MPTADEKNQAFVRMSSVSISLCLIPVDIVFMPLQGSSNPFCTRSRKSGCPFFIVNGNAMFPKRASNQIKIMLHDSIALFNFHNSNLLLSYE